MTQLEVGARPYYESCKDECGRDIYKLYLQFTDKWKDFGVNFKKSEKISFQKRAGGDFDENEVMGFSLEPIVFYKRQFEIFFGNHKLGLLEGSTKSGKTFAALWWVVYQALSISGKDRNVFIWAAPTQDQANITYNDLQNMYLSEIEDAGYCKFTQDPHPHITFCNGAIIKFVPASPANLMGNGVVAIVIDEASLCEKGIWTTINSITFQTEGLIRMLGNVISYGNWWNKICRDPVIKRNPRIKYDKLTIYEALEGGVITKEAVDFVRDMHRNEPSEFDRLYLCEPGEDGGNPFNQQKIEKITMPFLANGVPVAFGVDVAKSRDYTVIIGLNKECEVCYYRRFNKENWDTTNEIIIQSVGKEIYTCLDTTGVGSQTRDYIKDKVNLIDFNFTQRAKQELISDLIYVVHREKIRIPDDWGAGTIAPNLEKIESEICIRKEMMNFGYRRNSKGDVSYQAQNGEHDDTVMALALAYHAYTKAEEDGMLDTNYAWENYQILERGFDYDMNIFDKKFEDLF